MKRHIPLLVALGLLMVIGPGLVLAPAQNAPLLKASIALENHQNVPGKIVYQTGDSIKITLSLKNEGTSLYAPRGFKETPFYLHLMFKDPDGNLILATPQLDNDPGKDPEPPPVVPNYITGELLQAEAVEAVAGEWAVTVSIPKAQAYYKINKPGIYTVTAVIPLRTYNGIDHTVAGVSYANLANLNWEGTIRSKPVEFQILSAGGASVQVQAVKHVIGLGARPLCNKTPISGMEVRVYNKSTDRCITQYGIISWPHYNEIWGKCQPETFGVTDRDGKLDFRLAPTTYLLIGKFDPTPGTTGGELLVADTVWNLKSDQVRPAHLYIFQRADGRHLPGKYTQFTGSLLNIVEPEYVEWDNEKELYPFVFESVGDWTVQTSVLPPEGFVSDHQALSATVNSDVQAVQFTITDVGSRWVDSNVRHRIKHKGKWLNHRSRIGVKLTARLAKIKKLPLYGDQIPDLPHNDPIRRKK